MWGVCSPANENPDGHTTLKQRRFNVDSMSWHWLNVESTLFQRCVLAGFVPIWKFAIKAIFRLSFSYMCFVSKGNLIDQWLINGNMRKMKCICHMRLAKTQKSQGICVIWSGFCCLLTKATSTPASTWRLYSIASTSIITKTYLYNFDPLKHHFYIVKLEFTGVYIIFLISAQKHRLWVLVRTASLRRF